MMQELQTVLRAIREMSAEQLPELLGELEFVRTTALLRIATAPAVAQQSDSMIDIALAAERLGVSESYLYRHADQYQFTRREGRKLLFSSLGIDRYIAQRRK